MILHFSILFLILLVSFTYEHKFNSNKIKVIADGGLASDYKGSIIPWLIVFGYIALLAGMRTHVNDSYVYKTTFEACSGTWNEIYNIIIGGEKDKGFNITANLFKMFISKDYHMWFFSFAITESLIFAIVLRKESVSFIDSCFYLFAGTLYLNYFSMMRQWLAVLIVFAASKFIIQKKILLYILFCVLAAQFHTSAYFMIALYFLASGQPWKKKQIVISVAFVVGIILLDPLMGIVDSLTQDTTYNYVVSIMQQGKGSSWIRIIIAGIPLLLTYIYRNNIQKCGERYNFCVNIALINTLVITLAAFTSGLYVVRLSTYLSVYNSILYPYIFHIIASEKDKRLLRILYYVIFGIFYFIQMNHGTMAWYYESDVIGVFE